MTYGDWRTSYVAAGAADPGAQACLWNLENEGRIDCREFMDRLGTLDQQHRAAGTAPLDAANMAMTHATGECTPVDSRWLGRLPLDRAVTVPPVTITHIPFRNVIRFHNTRNLLDEHDPPPRQVQLDPLNAKVAGARMVPAKRFIWITWQHAATSLPDNPTAVRQQLGLEHYEVGDYVFRCSISIDRARHHLFVPTCLDAALNPPWKPPADPASPWGMTRDLTTGEERWPELLVEVADCMDQTPVGQLVSPPGQPVQPMQAVPVDYMVGR